MAFNVISLCIFCFLFTNSLTAPSRANLDDTDESLDVSTASSSLENYEKEHPWWDVEADGDEFGFDGNAWLQEPPFPSEATWDQSSPNLKEVNLENGDFIDQNFVSENDDDDEEMDSLSSKQNDSQQDLSHLTSDDEQKRDSVLKVRHAGRNSIPSSAFIIDQKLNEDDENDDESDDDDDALENYDAVSDSENNGEEDADEESNMFADENEVESKRLLEDKVFLF